MLRVLLLLLNTTGVPRLTYRLMLDRRVPLRLKLILPAALAYVISPIDLLPHILPGIDDLVVSVVALATFLLKAPRDVVIEHIRGSRGRPPPNGRQSPTVIEGSYHVVEEDDKAGKA